MKLPRQLSSGETVGPIAYNLLRKFVASLAPISSPSVRHDWRPGGVTSHATRAAGGSGSLDVSTFWLAPTTFDTEKEQVLISDGLLFHGTTAYTIAEAWVSCPNAVNYVHLKYEFGQTPVIEATARATPAAPAPDVYFHLIAKILNSDGSLSIARFNPGVVYVPVGIS